MSFDISLVDPVTHEVLQLPIKHIMIGGTYKADYDSETGTFTPQPTSEAYLNVTYNYSSYYHDVTQGDGRFVHEEISHYYSDGSVGETVLEYGIRGLKGKTGYQSIEMLEDMISRIEQKYHANGIWVNSERFKRILYIPELGKATTYLNFLDEFGWGNVPLNNVTEYMVDYWVSEGPSDNYWEPTAANALKPLHQLLVMAKLRPDGIWEVC